MLTSASYFSACWLTTISTLPTAAPWALRQALVVIIVHLSNFQYLISSSSRPWTILWSEIASIVRLTLLKISASSFLLYSSLRVLVFSVPTCLYALHVKSPLTFRQSAAALPDGFEAVASFAVLGVLAWGKGFILAGALTLVLAVAASCWVSVAKVDSWGRYSTCVRSTQLTRAIGSRRFSWWILCTQPCKRGLNMLYLTPALVASNTLLPMF